MRLTPLLLAMAVDALVIPSDAYCPDLVGAEAPCVSQGRGAPNIPFIGVPTREHLPPAALVNNLHLNNKQRRGIKPAKAADSFSDSIEGRAYALMQLMEQMDRVEDLKQKEAMKKEIVEVAMEIEAKKKEFVKLAKIIEIKKILSDQFLNPAQA